MFFSHICNFNQAKNFYALEQVDYYLQQTHLGLHHLTILPHITHLYTYIVFVGVI